jgi:hypothetical protein
LLTGYQDLTKFVVKKLELPPLNNMQVMEGEREERERRGERERD